MRATWLPTMPAKLLPALLLPALLLLLPAACRASTTTCAGPAALSATQFAAYDLSALQASSSCAGVVVFGDVYVGVLTRDVSQAFGTAYVHNATTLGYFAACYSPATYNLTYPAAAAICTTEGVRAYGAVNEFLQCERCPAGYFSSDAVTCVLCAANNTNTTLYPACRTQGVVSDYHAAATLDVALATCQQQGLYLLSSTTIASTQTEWLGVDALRAPLARFVTGDRILSHGAGMHVAPAWDCAMPSSLILTPQGQVGIDNVYAEYPFRCQSFVTCTEAQYWDGTACVAVTDCGVESLLQAATLYTDNVCDTASTAAMGVLHNGSAAGHRPGIPFCSLRFAEAGCGGGVTSEICVASGVCLNTTTAACPSCSVEVSCVSDSVARFTVYNQTSSCDAAFVPRWQAESYVSGQCFFDRFFIACSQPCFD